MCYRVSAASIFILLNIFGCISISSLQSGRTLQPNTFSGGVSVGYQVLGSSYRPFFIDATSEVQSENPAAATVINFSLNYGLLPKLQIGARYSLLGAYGGDVKYQVFGYQSPFALSVGGGIEYGKVEDSYSKTDSQNSTTYFLNQISLMHLHFPVYLSYDVSNELTVSLIPQYIFSNYKALSFQESLKETRSTFAVSTAVFWKAFGLEYSYAIGQKNITLQQFMFGIILGRGNEKPVESPKKGKPVQSTQF